METSIYDQVAEIESIGIIETNEIYRSNKRYAIVADWTFDALELFDTLDDARQFIRGFKKHPTEQFTLSYHRGRVLRRFVDSDLKEFGHTYTKKVDIKTIYKDILID